MSMSGDGDVLAAAGRVTAVETGMQQLDRCDERSNVLDETS